MRKTFLTFCVAALSLLTVSSCYDDSSLWTEIDNLKDKIEALETRLNEQVSALNTAIGAVEAKVAVVKVEKNAAGNYVLTFSNNETLEISAADANANNTGLVTTVTEDGVTYWAVVGADGKVTKLDAVVHPDTKIQFKVDPETKALLVSYDGTNYEATGVFVDDEASLNIVEKFVDAEGYVVLTVGGVEYKLPKVSLNHFEIVSGMQYFTYDENGMPETKVIPVDMAGIVSYMVAKAPAGWTVKLSDKGLEVTAPYEDDYEADQSGVIEIWVVTEDGQTKVSSVKVSVGAAPATFAFANNFEDVTVTFASSSELYYFGVVKASEYDAAAVVEQVTASAYELQDGVFWNDDNNGNYVSTAEYKFAELLGSAPVAGETYTFWSVSVSWEQDPMDWMAPATIKVAAEDIVLKDVTVYTITVAEPVVTFKDASLDVVVEGADQFYMGFVDLFSFGVSLEELPLMLSAYSEGTDLLDFLKNGMNTGWGPSMKITNGDVFTGEFKGALSDFNSETFSVIPGGAYAGVVLPLFDGKTDYSVADIFFFEEAMELPALSFDGEATIEFTAPTTSYNSFKVSVKTTGERVYYGVTEAGEFDATDKNLIVELVDMLHMFSSKDGNEFDLQIKNTMWDSTVGLIPETEYELIAFAVSADGKCSDAVSLPFKTNPLETTDAITVTSIEASAADEIATATFTIAGDAVALYYAMDRVANVPTDETEYADYLKELQLDYFTGGWRVACVELTKDNFVDGKITLTGDPEDYSDPLAVGNAQSRVIFAFAQGADGKISQIAKSNEFKDATQE